MRILVSDPVAGEGVDYLRQHAEVDVRVGMKPEELIRCIPEYDALVVRSETKVTAEAQVDVVLAGGPMLLSYHRDRPGMIGHLGTLLGDAGVNISFMAVGRLEPRGEALMVIGTDGEDLTSE